MTNAEFESNPADRALSPKRVAVVTGGASGLGAATVRRLLSIGHAVAIWDNSTANLAEFGHELSDSPDCILLEVDATDPQSVSDAGKRTREALGPISILVACAGGGGEAGVRPCVDFPLEQWREVLDLNLTSAHLSCQEVLHDMLEAGWGRIVLVSSMAGKEGNARMLAYAAAKAGIIGYVKSMGKELAETGVIVNGIVPTIFDTPMFQEGNERDNGRMRREVIAKLPMGRLGKPDEFAALANWLVSDECSFTTGFMFDISGGRATY